MRRVAEIENPTWRCFYHHTKERLAKVEIFANIKRRTTNRKLQFAVSREEFGAKVLPICIR